MAQPNNVNNLYAELNRFGQKEEYDKAIKTANKILHVAPQEFEAFNCKVVSHILSDRFTDALTLINKDKFHVGKLTFEKAYCEYRLNRTEQALTTLRSITSHTTRSKELLGQVLYRLEDYEECYDLYRDLIKNSQDDFDGERETNLAAVLASLQLWGVKDVDDAGLEENTYEVCYNNACYYIGREDYDTAMAKLKSAEEMLRADSDMTEEDLDEELAIIRVQRGYILQMQSKHDEASHLYNQVLKIKPSDMGLTAVVSNNVVTVNKDQNIFDSKKKMKTATADNVKHKTVSAQRKNIQYNQCLLHMYSNQADQCHNLAKSIASEFDGDDNPQLICVAQYARDKKMDKAITVLKELSRSSPDMLMKTHLILAQLYLSQGHAGRACEALKNLGEMAYAPGVVSMLVNLYLTQEDTESASNVLIDAVKWYKKNEPKSETALQLTKINAEFQIKYGKAEEAVKMLEDMYKLNPGDPLVVAQLISSYAKINSSKVKQIGKDLPPVSEIIKGVDVDALENSFSTLGPKYMKKQQQAQPSKGETSPSPRSPDTKEGTGDNLVLKKKQRKKKKGKLPQNCTPGVGIDPERWIPRRERSDFKVKRKDKRNKDKEIGKGTQGMSAATQAIADSLDASKYPSQQSPGAGSSSTASPQATPVPTQVGPRQQKPAQAASKKKKKGGKGNRW